jgi:hypothetical protein
VAENIRIRVHTWIHMYVGRQRNVKQTSLENNVQNRERSFEVRKKKEKKKKRKKRKKESKNVDQNRFRDKVGFT